METQKLSAMLILALICAQFTLQRLQVLSPDQTSPENHFKESKIEYVIGHYGDVEYGGSLVGFVHKSSSKDGCSTLDHIDPFDDSDNQPILIVDRGNCQFYTKSLNAQYAGAKLLIIVDTLNTLDFYPVAYDKKALEIKIPTIVIKKSDGDELRKLLEHEDENISKSVILEFNLPLPEKDVVHMKLIMTSADKEAYQFMYDFKNHMASLGDNFKFEPVFYWDVLKLNDDVISDEQVKKEKCAMDATLELNGYTQFCLLSVDHPRPTIDSQVFQMCLWPEMEPTEFFDFGKMYLESCLSNKNYYQTNLAYSGEYGASCKCPNGEIYNVGSTDASCSNAKCMGGTVTECFGEKSKKWTHKLSVNKDVSIQYKWKNKGVYCASNNDNSKLADLYTCVQDVAVLFGHRKRRAARTCQDEAFNKRLVDHYTNIEEKIHKAGVYSHPTLMVNGKPIYGGISADSAFNAACEAFLDPPASCS